MDSIEPQVTPLTKTVQKLIYYYGVSYGSTRMSRQREKNRTPRNKFNEGVLKPTKAGSARFVATVTGATEIDNGFERNLRGNPH
jgi:hypothetical protein